jgi:hypothetical protein
MSYEALDAAKSQLLQDGLGFPPVPDELIVRFQEFGPWRWGTRKLNAGQMYSFVHFADGAGQRVSVPRNYVALSQGGHGINSYALTYHLVYRPIAIIFQIGWGGAYMDPADGTRSFARYCALSSGLVELAGKIRHGRKSFPGIGLVEYSEQYRISNFRVLETARRADTWPPEEARSRPENIGSEIAFKNAREWLLSLARGRL